MTAQRRSSIRVLLADVPAGVPRANFADAAALGARADVAKRLQEILPGATFDDKGHGVFKRTAYTIGFSFEEPSPLMIRVELEGIDGIAALKRVSEKTGWQAVDPDSLRLLDLEGTRSTGAPAFVLDTIRRQEPAQEARSFLIGKRLLQVAAVVLALWGSWSWMTKAAAPSEPTVPMPNLAGLAQQGSGKPASVQEISDRIVGAVINAKRYQAAYLKAVGPKFRANPAVAQLFAFSLAEWAYSSGFGMGRFAKPERLSDAEFWKKFEISAPLPPKFAEAQRDGYRFEFSGDKCGPMANNMSAPQDDCDAFVYAATPVDDKRPAFALLTEDGKIHYCGDAGCTPSSTDPTVDNTDASSHADLINGGEPAPTGLAAVVLRSLTTAIERLMGDKPGSTEVNEAETTAIKDLRELAHAELAFNAMTNGARFAAPEALADATAFTRIKMAPLLPGYFAQPVRFGYEFHFNGQTAVASNGAFDWINPQYSSFVYSARPVAGGPRARRSFAVFPDGAVYATTEARVATRQDTALGTQ